jgi:predicted transposase/invertase (TIGR01784 family)
MAEYDRIDRESVAKKQGEKKEKIEIAKKMIAKGKSIEEIIELTELPEQEVEKLINDKNKQSDD